MESDVKFVIGIKQVRSQFEWKRPIPEEEQIWCYLAKDNGIIGSGELCFSKSGCYRINFYSAEEAISYWNECKHTIREDWDLYDKNSICVRRFLYDYLFHTEHVTSLSFE